MTSNVNNCLCPSRNTSSREASAENGACIICGKAFETIDVTPFGKSWILEQVVERVDHPAHYGGADNPYEAIKVIRAWGLGFSLGNAVKYIARAGRKDATKHIEDLKKARWYLDEEIGQLEAQANGG